MPAPSFTLVQLRYFAAEPERHRITELWRSERWDSLVANSPAWHDRFRRSWGGAPSTWPTELGRYQAYQGSRLYGDGWPQSTAGG